MRVKMRSSTLAGDLWLRWVNFHFEFLKTLKTKTFIAFKTCTLRNIFRQSFVWYKFKYFITLLPLNDFEFFIWKQVVFPIIKICIYWNSSNFAYYFSFHKWHYKFWPWKLFKQNKNWWQTIQSINLIFAWSI